MIANRIVVRMRRPDGLEVVLRLPAKNLQALMRRANAEFGNVRITRGHEKPGSFLGAECPRCGCKRVSC